MTADTTTGTAALGEPTMLTCPECKGMGTIHSEYRPRPRPCGMRCDAGDDAVYRVRIDPRAIEAEMVASRGATKGRFRRSRPKLVEDGGVYGAAYVWRMIRFHCGQDMTMPVMAGDYIGCSWVIDDHGRAVMTVLDGLAETLGQQFFGGGATYRAAARWGVAMYGSSAPVDPAAREVPQKDRRGDEVTFGDLAEALGVHGVGDGLDIGGVDESPEHFVETVLLDGDGNNDESLLDAQSGE